MALGAAQAEQVWKGLLAQDPSLATFCTKIDLQNTVLAADEWLSGALADTMVMSMSDSVPEPWRSQASPVQRQALMAALVLMRNIADPDPTNAP